MANRAPLRPVALALLIFSAHLVLPDAAPIIPQTTSRQNGEEGDYFEGDIRSKLGEDPYTIRSRYARRQERMVMGSGNNEPVPQSIWPNRTVYYSFDSDLDPVYRDSFENAMQEWISLTCIEFKHRTPESPNYLLYSDKFDCSSYVGMQGGQQDISINNNCRKVGHAMHEIGHALGLWHEHSRPDRDSYVEIKWDNIGLPDYVKELTNYFGRLTMEEFEPISKLNVMYDFESIMHYDEYAFSTNPGTRPTIQIKNSIKLPHCMDGFQLGQRSRISWRDQLRINRLYQCTEKVEQLLASKPECDPLVPDPTTSSSTLTPTPTAAPVQTSLPTPTPTPTITGTMEMDVYYNFDSDLGDPVSTDAIAVGTIMAVLTVLLIISWTVFAVLIYWRHYQRHKEILVMDNVIAAGYMDGDNSAYGYSEELVSIR